MKRNEQLILVGLVVVGLLVAFWIVILSPKRNEASQLQDQVNELNSSLSQAQQELSAGEQARKGFRIDYRRLVVLGKAVPADGEQGSLLVQLQQLADRSQVSFDSIDLGDSSGAATAAPSTPTTSTSTDTSTSSTDSSTSSTDASTSSTDSSTSTSTTTGGASSSPTASVPATEASAATLPIGASVGPAGLPVMPYDLSFKGGFFQIADFLKRVDGLVHTRKGRVDVSGRLLTVDGFTLTPADTGLSATPQLTADLSVTSYLTPADQGLTGGASPSGPAPAAPTLASSQTTAPAGSTPTSTPTATSTSP